MGKQGQIVASYLMNESSSLGVSASGGGIPESATKGDGTEAVCTCKYLSQAVKWVHLLVRVDEGVGVCLCASAVEGEGSEIVSSNVGEVGLHSGVAGSGVGTEPGGVTGARRGVGLEVTERQAVRVCIYKE